MFYSCVFSIDAVLETDAMKSVWARAPLRKSPFNVKGAPLTKGCPRRSKICSQ